MSSWNGVGQTLNLIRGGGPQKEDAKIAAFWWTSPFRPSVFCFWGQGSVWSQTTTGAPRSTNWSSSLTSWSVRFVWNAKLNQPSAFDCTTIWITCAGSRWQRSCFWLWFCAMGGSGGHLYFTDLYNNLGAAFLHFVTTVTSACCSFTCFAFVIDDATKNILNCEIVRHLNSSRSQRTTSSILQKICRSVFYFQLRAFWKIICCHEICLMRQKRSLCGPTAEAQLFQTEMSGRLHELRICCMLADTYWVYLWYDILHVVREDDLCKMLVGVEANSTTLNFAHSISCIRYCPLH